MTLSIAGWCARTGQIGVAITSSSPAVAARCAYVRAGIGAASTQNITDPRLGPRALDLMEAGKTAAEAVDEIAATEPLIAYRQLTAVKLGGDTGAFSGERTLGTYAVARGERGVAAGNLLANPEVPAAMLAAFDATETDATLEMGDRLLAALQAGIAAGGEAGPVHSAGILIADRAPWPATDLRVDWSDDPIAELAKIWSVWKPQWRDYATRAVDPSAAPSYGVPGDPAS
jgi:uncharacterized Ntn-hydrolase superfamily protein